MQATASEPPCPHRVGDLLTVTEPGSTALECSRSALGAVSAPRVPPATDTEAIPPSSPAISSSGARSISVPGIAFRQSDAAECERVRSRNYFLGAPISATFEELDQLPAGIRTVNTEPLPGSLATVTSPSIMRASLRDRARPSPVPP